MKYRSSFCRSWQASLRPMLSARLPTASRIESCRSYSAPRAAAGSAGSSRRSILKTRDEDGHQGGRRYQPTDPGYQVLLTWARNQAKLQGR